jgi:hypothetical protein
VVASPAMAGTNQSCSWSTWYSSPTQCISEQGTKYAWDEVSWQDLTGPGEGTIWVVDNDYAGCPDCTGQGSNAPAWRRVNSTIGSWQTGAGGWHTTPHTTQWGGNPSTVQNQPSNARILIEYEETSENGPFSEWTDYFQVGF